MMRPSAPTAVAATAMVAMTWRRVHPLAVAFVVAAAFAVLSANGGGLSVALGLLIVSFTLGSETSGRRSHVGAGLLATVVVVAFVFVPVFEPFGNAGVVEGVTAFVDIFGDVVLLYNIIFGIVGRADVAPAVKIKPCVVWVKRAVKASDYFQRAQVIKRVIKFFHASYPVVVAILGPAVIVPQIDLLIVS